MQVSIIIVNYNTKTLTENCLSSIYLHTKDITYEVIVSDNGSTDGSCNMIKTRFPGVALLENNKNIGFGAANNRGLETARGRYIFYLNSDTVLLNNAVKMFYDFWEQSQDNSRLGALGCMLLNTDLKPTHSFGNFSSAGQELKEKIFVSPKEETDLPPPLPCEVEYIAGAALFLKNDAFARFDERFFLYFEDSDLQLQLAAAGRKRIIIPGPKIIHLEGASNIRTTKAAFEGSPSRIQFALSKIKYYRKRKDSRILILIIKVLLLLKWLNPQIFPHTAKFFRQLMKA
jgi:GT2 family glycosyltransferase